MQQDDLDYYYRRAEHELEMAQRAAMPAAVRAHYTIANFYLDRVYRAAEDEQTAPA